KSGGSRKLKYLDHKTPRHEVENMKRVVEGSLKELGERENREANMTGPKGESFRARRAPENRNERAKLNEILEEADYLLGGRKDASDKPDYVRMSEEEWRRLDDPEELAKDYEKLAVSTRGRNHELASLYAEKAEQIRAQIKRRRIR